MSADWKLQQAVMALRSGANAVLAEDPDAHLLDGVDLVDEVGAVEFAMRQIVRETQDAQDIAAAARHRATEAAERARRFEARALRYKGLLLAAMDAMGWRKKEWPEATVSLRAGQPNVIITDETQLPEIFIRIRLEPDKESLRAALKDGASIPGAALTNNLPSVQIRSN